MGGGAAEEEVIVKMDEAGMKTHCFLHVFPSCFLNQSNSAYKHSQTVAPRHRLTANKIQQVWTAGFMVSVLLSGLNKT